MCVTMYNINNNNNNKVGNPFDLISEVDVLAGFCMARRYLI